MFFKGLNRDLSKEDFFDNAYKMFAKRVYFYAFSYMQDNEKASDVTQEVFLTLWEKIDSLDESGEVFPLLITLAKYRCLNILRKDKYRNKYKDNNKVTDADISILTLESDYSNGLYTKEVESLIVRAIEKMPVKVRETFICSRYKMHKNKETAQMLNISEKTVEYRISSAYKILRKVLKDYFIVILLSPLCDIFRL